MRDIFFLFKMRKSLIVRELKHKYISPVAKVISMTVYTPLLQVSIGSFIETPIDGDDIGDDE